MKNNTSHFINQSKINSSLQDVRKYTTLTREEENKLIIKIRNGCEKSKELLIYSNLRYVIKMAKKYQNQGLDIIDLISEGNYGLIKASERFDYNQTDVRFLSYAIWWIKQSMLQSLHENSRSIRLPVNIINEMNTLRKKMPNEFNEVNTPESILGLPTIKYLDAPLNDNEDGSAFLYDTIEDKSAKRPDLIFDDDRKAIDNHLKKILSNLNDSEKYVAIKFFGLDGQNSLTLQDISDDMDLTKERVRQIKERAVKKLRFYAKDLFELL
jgi:RNA polymerase primary sigma factor